MTHLKQHNNLIGKNPRVNERGFTLIELMVTLAIAAIVITQGIPAFTNTVQNSRISTNTNDLVADINIARSEAISRNVAVILCRSDDPRLAGAGCDGAGAWTSGWMVFADDDGSGTFEAANDTLIRIGQPASAPVFINSNGVNSIQYNSNGMTASAADSVFAVCDTRGTDFGREIRVNTTGRPRLTRGTPDSPITSCSPA